jgi:hypothetical protein
MKQGYTRSEAENLIDQLFETEATLTRVPKRTRGRVVEAIDAGDHWNVLIEWELPGIPAHGWYDKFDVQRSMRRIQS